jgi:hypothetical protein
MEQDFPVEQDFPMAKEVKGMRFCMAKWAVGLKAGIGLVVAVCLLGCCGPCRNCCTDTKQAGMAKYEK